MKSVLVFSFTFEFLDFTFTENAENGPSVSQLVPAGRVSSLVHLDINYLVVTNNSLKFVPGHSMKVIEIKAFEDKSLCPVKAVSCYRDRTAPLQGQESQLLISYLMPYKKVVSSTVSQWIVDLLQKAGVDTEKLYAWGSHFGFIQIGSGNQGYSLDWLQFRFHVQ